MHDSVSPNGEATQDLLGTVRVFLEDWLKDRLVGSGAEFGPRSTEPVQDPAEQRIPNPHV